MFGYKKIQAILTQKERKGLLMLIGLMFIGMLLEMLGLGFVIPAITLLTQENPGAQFPVVQPLLIKLGNPSQQQLVVMGLFLLVCIYTIKTIFLAFLAWKETRFAFGVQAQLSRQMFFTYLNQPYTFYLQRNSAELIRNTINEVSVFIGYALVPIMLLITESLVMFGIGVLLLIVEPVGTLIVSLMLGSAAWGFHRITRSRIVKWGENRQFHEGERIQHLQEGFGGIKDVKLFGREEYLISQYDIDNGLSARASQLQATLQKLPRLWLEFLAIAGMFLLTLTMLAQGRDIENIVPTLGLFAIAAFRLMPSVNRILSAIQNLRYGLPVVNIINDELNLSLDANIEDKVEVSALEKNIEIKNLNYRYPDSTAPALCNINFSINKGEFIGIIGSSGSGKSTLVDIILGLLSPDSGEVLIDGKDIHLNLRGWQNHIGYVPQSIYLADDSLKRNIAYGLSDENIDNSALYSAIRAAQLEEFMETLPDGVETIVGERGVRLSGGQRQRIGIARALYHDPSILVLDEATSALDVSTENEVMQAVNALHGVKTVIIIAHRLSTVEQCDRLINLEKGEIISEGNPSDIIHVNSRPS